LNKFDISLKNKNENVSSAFLQNIETGIHAHEKLIFSIRIGIQVRRRM